ncbi:MAG: DUF177 domain-containing protein [Acidobacteria bacterium]|nr:DUF177 domain-containing protein [Acidobacteriota bacterium]
MFFSVRDLELRKVEFDTSFPPGKIDFLDPNLHQQGDLRTRGSVELLSHTLGELRVKGHLAVSMTAPCDRCLEAAVSHIDSDFDLFYEPASIAVEQEEVELGEGETEIGYYEGDGIELGEVLREFVILAMPMQKLCQAECKGICPVCGQNRNLTACHCEVKPADDRWAVLKNL